MNRFLNKKLYQKRADILKALAHPSRLLIVDVLNDRGELCVCDIMKVVGSDQSTVSKHLSIMKQSGIIDHRRDGKNSMYRLARPCVLDFITCIEQVMKENLKEQRELLAS
jgi:DNA-binding transcriptional ArsR family regulator